MNGAGHKNFENFASFDSFDECGEPLGTSFILARLPAGLPDPGGPAEDLPEAVLAYRAHLAAHPDDGGAWEGLAYLYLRMDSEEADRVGLGPEDLGDPPDTSYALLHYEATSRAVQLRPTAMGLRAELNRTISNAVAAASRPYTDHSLVEALGGMTAARRIQLRLIQETLDLIARFPDRWDDEELEWRTSQALALSELPDYPQAVAAWEAVLTHLDGWSEENSLDHPTLANPRFAHLMLFEATLALGDLMRAERELDLAENESAAGELPLLRQRFQLLQAQGEMEQATRLARDAAAQALEEHRRAPEDAYLLQAADWLEQAGDLDGARDLLRRVATGDGYGREAARSALDRLNSTPGSAEA